MEKIESELIKQEAKPSISEENVSISRFQPSPQLLPRKGWQYRKAYLQAVMKVKAVLEIIELDFLIS